MVEGQDSFREMLPDDFSKVLLDGGLEVLAGKNPIRAHLFAAVMREVLTYLLHEMAPDDELEAVPWFEKQADRPTRRQRMTFAIQGGLSDALVTELGVDASDMHRRVAAEVAELNKRTHVKPGTLLTEDTEIRDFASDVIAAVAEFLEVISDMRDAVAEAVVHGASEQVFGSFLQESNDVIDLLSSHSFVEQVDVESVRVLKIGAHEVTYEAEGVIYVELNYGSASDRAAGDGATMNDDYPFKCRMTGSVIDPKDIHAVFDMNVDTSSFYED